jgi:hypothetical protein
MRAQRSRGAAIVDLAPLPGRWEGDEVDGSGGHRDNQVAAPAEEPAARASDVTGEAGAGELRVAELGHGDGEVRVHDRLLSWGRVHRALLSTVGRIG